MPSRRAHRASSLVHVARHAPPPPPLARPCLGRRRNPAPRRQTDDDGLARSCAVGRQLGFVGRATIHPRQLAVIAAAFAPSALEVEHARRVVEAVHDAREAGSGTFVLPDGTFLDVAMVERARRTIALADWIAQP